MRSFDEINEKVFEMKSLSKRLTKDEEILRGNVPISGKIAHIEILTVITTLAWVLGVTEDIGMAYGVDKDGILRLRSQMMEDGKL